MQLGVPDRTEIHAMARGIGPRPNKVIVFDNRLPTVDGVIESLQRRSLVPIVRDSFEGLEEALNPNPDESEGLPFALFIDMRLEGERNFAAFGRRKSIKDENVGGLELVTEILSKRPIIRLLPMIFISAYENIAKEQLRKLRQDGQKICFVSKRNFETYADGVLSESKLYLDRLFLEAGLQSALSESGELADAEYRRLFVRCMAYFGAKRTERSEFLGFGAHDSLKKIFETGSTVLSRDVRFRIDSFADIVAQLSLIVTEEEAAGYIRGEVLGGTSKTLYEAMRYGSIEEIARVKMQLQGLTGGAL